MPRAATIARVRAFLLRVPHPYHVAWIADELCMSVQHCRLCVKVLWEAGELDRTYDPDYGRFSYIALAKPDHPPAAA